MSTALRPVLQAADGAVRAADGAVSAEKDVLESTPWWIAMILICTVVPLLAVLKAAALLLAYAAALSG